MSAAEINVLLPEQDLFTHQVRCDINFLESRLKIMRQQTLPNERVIHTYEGMLNSRLQVLERLKDENLQTPLQIQ